MTLKRVRQRRDIGYPAQAWPSQMTAARIPGAATTHFQGRKTGFAWYFHELSRANGPDGHLRKATLQNQTTRQRQRRGIM
jgi:hypothetical protein